MDMHDSRLIGTWRPDARKTAREVAVGHDMTPSRKKKLLRQFFGKMVLRYTPTRCYSLLKGQVSVNRYLVVAKDRIPWGHLNTVDMGTGGYRIVPSGASPLGCPDVAIGDPVEIDGRNINRKGKVLDKSLIRLSGKMTSRNVSNQLAPRLRAASSSVWSGQCPCSSKKVRLALKN